MPAALQRAAALAHEQDRQVVVIVGVAVAQARAVDEHDVVEQCGAVRFLRGLQLADQIRELLQVIVGAPQVVVPDDSRQAQLVGELTLPDSGRFADPHVVVVDPSADLTDQVLGVGELGNPQHPAAPDMNDAGPGSARSQTWQLSVGR